MRLAPLIVILVSAVFIAGCTSEPPVGPPEVTVTDIAVSDLSLESMDLVVFLAVDNPNPIEITIGRVEMDVSYSKDRAEVLLGSGTAGAITVPASNQTEVTVPITMDNAAMLSAAAVLLLSGELEVKVEGIATVDAGVASFDVPFEKTEKVSVRD
ncbi:LEA14-like dessication related protein [Methanofollis sp. W23]|uniref:LEA type 2 family protein n=1 Tax=Methanofollis sp. W23 TaxID=2817849 RepID=UPI001AEAB9E8|nr:LEA type 2 family protein [Methanofollis sp. W23]MBP2147154.1 LEA14-like dessication related protein [Methanofollis sp. W23]